MSHRIDMIGKTFGRLTVIQYDARNSRRPHWLCRCICGAEVILDGHNLRKGTTKSCGCLRIDIGRRNGLMANLKHGKKHSTEYKIWCGIKARCTNKNDPAYLDYGGRGITVCSRWNIFMNFFADMGERPSNHSINRIDNDGPYSPENCQWATAKENARNRRDTIFVTFRGKAITLAEMADILGISYNTIWKRYSRDDYPLDRPLK